MWPAEDFLSVLYAEIAMITLTHEQRLQKHVSKEPIDRNVHYCHERITFMPQIGGTQDVFVTLAPV